MLLVGACKHSPAPAAPTPIAGVVQKGPFVRGSAVTVQSLDDQLAPTGQSFDVPTSDDLGDFALPVHATSQYVEVIANGYYFDELTGQLCRLARLPCARSRARRRAAPSTSTC